MVCLVSGVLYVATEFATHGNLLNLLRQSRCLETDPTYANKATTVSSLSQEQLLRFAADVSLGMQHLAEKGVRVCETVLKYFIRQIKFCYSETLFKYSSRCDNV